MAVYASSSRSRWSDNRLATNKPRQMRPTKSRLASTGRDLCTALRPNEEAISGRATPTAARIRGKHCKPAHTPGPLHCLVRPHAEDEQGCRRGDRTSGPAGARGSRRAADRGADGRKTATVRGFTKRREDTTAKPALGAA